MANQSLWGAALNFSQIATLLCIDTTMLIANADGGLLLLTRRLLMLGANEAKQRLL